MPTCRVQLDRPVNGFDVYDLTDVPNTDAAFEQARSQFPEARPVYAIEVTDDPDGHTVNGVPVAFPYDGPPQPQVALNDNLEPILDPLDREDFELCAAAVHAIGPDLMLTDRPFTDAELAGINARLETRPWVFPPVPDAEETG